MPTTHRTHGQAPFRAVVVHGGPGAPGTVSSLARALSSIVGTLEPFQRAMTVAGQVDELAAQIEAFASPPVALFGHSWGAWLVALLSSRRPELVCKAFLVGAGAFDAAYVPVMNERRRARLGSEQRAEYDDLPERIERAGAAERPALLARLGYLAAIADTVRVRDVAENREDALPLNAEQYAAIWREASALRARGDLVAIASRIRAPVRILQGDSDPCPIAAVVEPIRGLVADLRWFEIPRSGHEPWKEEAGRDEFWAIVRRELAMPEQRPER